MATAVGERRIADHPLRIPVRGDRRGVERLGGRVGRRYGSDRGEPDQQPGVRLRGAGGQHAGQGSGGDGRAGTQHAQHRRGWRRRGWRRPHRCDGAGSADKPGGRGRRRPGCADVGRSGGRRRGGDHNGLPVPDRQEEPLGLPSVPPKPPIRSPDSSTARPTSSRCGR